MQYNYWSLQSEKTFLMSTPKRLGVQIFRRSALGYTPLFETASERSELFTDLCHQ